MHIGFDDDERIKDIEDFKKRNKMLSRILLGITFLLFLFKLFFMPDLRWVYVFMPLWLSIVLFLILYTLVVLVVKFTKDL
jgi:hypothetical protein